jgi:hypothetical protein
MMREQMLNVHALFELTGVPTLYRWGRAIWERRPIHEVEREYFERIFRQLQQIGATAPSPPRLEVPQRGIIPADYIAEGRREPPPTVHVPKQVSDIIAADMPDDLRKKMQMMGVPTSPEDVAAAVAGRSLVMAPAVLPGMAGMTKEAAKQLAKIAAAGFGVGGTGAAVTRVVQGFPEEAPRAFLEVGLASTVAADIASALRGLATGVSAPQLRAITRQALRRQQEMRGLTWRDPEGEAFMREVEDAVLRLKQGDASKYDALVKQMEEWQKKIDEFNRLYELRQRGQLPPEAESRYMNLLAEVSKIRDRYENLKMYIDAARELGVEVKYLQPLRDVERLAEAAREMPPGPPVKDLLQRLQEMDYERLRRIVNDPAARASLAKRWRIDEQALAEQAAAFLRQKQVERLSQLTSEELRRILTDRDLLKKYAAELAASEDDLMLKIEEILQQRAGLAPKTETKAEPPPEPPRPPPRAEHQMRLPDTEGVATRGGYVTVVRPREERVAARRVDELPDVQRRLKILMGRQPQARESPLRADDFAGRRRGDATAATDEQTSRVRPGDEQAPRDRTKQTDEQPAPGAARTSDRETATDAATAAASERVVVDREALRTIIPALPAHVFSMPATSVLALISRAVGAPIVLAPNLPRPLPRESFGAWLDRVFGSGFAWRSLAAQRETFVFA